MNTENTAWARSLAPSLAGHRGMSGIELLPHGLDALSARLALADTAEVCLDVQYYIWRPDDTGRLLAERLVRAADRGVPVRLLLDDIGGSASDEVLLALDMHANIAVRLFNPVANRSFRTLSTLFDFQRVNRRMHNKSFTADRSVTIVGGRNVADHYYASGDEPQFADFDVLAAGPAAGDVASMFDQYWHHPSSVPVSALLRKSISRPFSLSMIFGGADVMRRLRAAPVPLFCTINASENGMLGSIVGVNGPSLKRPRSWKYCMTRRGLGSTEVGTGASGTAITLPFCG